jgi:dihydrodipicolinate synthase/N-acetylneuraminate lyase
MTMPLRGVLPIAPTPFTESGDVDVDGQRRVLDCMIDQGVDGICTRFVCSPTSRSSSC